MKILAILAAGALVHLEEEAVLGGGIGTPKLGFGLGARLGLSLSVFFLGLGDYNNRSFVNCRGGWA